MKDLAAALVAAQREMPAVEKDGTNPHFRSAFTTLDHLIAKTKPVLAKHDLTIVQLPAALDGQPALTTTLLHTSGESISSTMLLLAKGDPQGQGAALSYARRYAWAAALGISTETDDDGESAQPKDEPAAPPLEPWNTEPAGTKPDTTFKNPTVVAATAAQLKKLDVMVAKLREGGHITAEQLWRAVRPEAKAGPDGDWHWSDLRPLLTKGEASHLIERLQNFEANVGVQGQLGDAA